MKYSIIILFVSDHDFLARLLMDACDIQSQDYDADNLASGCCYCLETTMLLKHTYKLN